MIRKGTFEPDPSGVPFSGDGGLFRWVGSNGGTTEYVNPHTTRKVIVTASSLLNVWCTLEKFIQHTPPGRVENNFTNNEPGSWVAVQLAVAVALKGYDLRYGGNGGSWVLRNWNLEGSNDGVEWVLHQHANDRSLAAPGHSTASWEVNNPDGLAFSRFRVIMTGPHSNGGHSLCMMRLELYGRVEGGGGGGGFAPRTVRFPHCLLLFLLETQLHCRAAPQGTTPARAACYRVQTVPHALLRGSARSRIAWSACVRVRLQHRQHGILTLCPPRTASALLFKPTCFVTQYHDPTPSHL